MLCHAMRATLKLRKAEEEKEEEKVVPMKEKEVGPRNNHTRGVINICFRSPPYGDSSLVTKLPCRPLRPLPYTGS